MKSRKVVQRSYRQKLLYVAVAACFSVQPVYANPVGGQVVRGGASFSQQGNTLTITNTPGAIVNWRQFSIGAGETTRFIQQSANSAILNRVVGVDPSSILGNLSSNGRVYLINPNGILFGAGSRIDTAGFVASTLNMSDQDFINGRNNFAVDKIAGKINNQGTISTPAGGSVYLIAPEIENNGIITSPKGEILLAAGKTVELVDTIDPSLRVKYTAPEGQGVVNLGQIIAEGGKAGIYAGLISQKGTVSASSAVAQGGRIYFKATEGTNLEGGSSTTADGTSGGIVTVQTTNGDTIADNARLSANGNSGKGGTVEVLGQRVGLTGATGVSTDGRTGGGTVLVGGDYQGKNPDIQNASATYFGNDASLSANATDKGDGGKVIVWADDTTRAYGTITARGGANSGDGGFVETSGHRFLDVNGIRRVDASANHGSAGQWLLDPNDITITAGSGTAQSGTPYLFAPGTTSSITDGTINATLNSGSDVKIKTDASGTGGSGDILVGAGVAINSSTSNRKLTLEAYRNIDLQGTFSTGSTGTLTIELNPGTGGTGAVTSIGSLTLDSSFGGALVAELQSGKVWNNSGTVNLLGSSQIHLHDGTTPSTFNNLSGATLNLDSAGGSFGFDFYSSANNDGVINNAGIINVTTGTAFEAEYNQGTSGVLNIGSLQQLSLQNARTVSGHVTFSDNTSRLWISEFHGNTASFVDTVMTTTGNGGIINVGSTSASYSPHASFQNVSAPDITLTVGNVDYPSMTATVDFVNGTSVFDDLVQQGGVNSFNLNNATLALTSIHSTASVFTIPGSTTYSGNVGYLVANDLTLSSSTSSPIVTNGSVTLVAGWDGSSPVTAPISAGWFDLIVGRSVNACGGGAASASCGNVLLVAGNKAQGTSQLLLGQFGSFGVNVTGNIVSLVAPQIATDATTGSSAVSGWSEVRLLADAINFTAPPPAISAADPVGGAILFNVYTAGTSITWGTTPNSLCISDPQGCLLLDPTSFNLMPSKGLAIGNNGVIDPSPATDTVYIDANINQGSNLLALLAVTGVVQNPATSITAGQLGVIAGFGGATLNGSNAVSTIAANVGSGAFSLTDSTSALTVGAVAGNALHPLNLNGVSAGGAVNITNSTGSIAVQARPDATPELQGASVHLTAATGISTQNGVDMTAYSGPATVALSTTGTGDIVLGTGQIKSDSGISIFAANGSITSAADMTQQAAYGGPFLIHLSAFSGDVNLSGSIANNDTGYASGSLAVDINAGGMLNLSGAAIHAATGDIRLQSYGGSIMFDATSGIDLLQSGASAYLDAQSGAITMAPGSWVNATRVAAKAADGISLYTLDVGAIAASNSATGNINIFDSGTASALQVTQVSSTFMGTVNGVSNAAPAVAGTPGQQFFTSGNTFINSERDVIVNQNVSGNGEVGVTAGKAGGALVVNNANISGQSIDLRGDNISLTGSTLVNAGTNGTVMLAGGATGRKIEVYSGTPVSSSANALLIDSTPGTGTLSHLAGKWIGIGAGTHLPSGDILVSGAVSTASFASANADQTFFLAAGDPAATISQTASGIITMPRFGVWSNGGNVTLTAANMVDGINIHGGAGSASFNNAKSFGIGVSQDPIDGFVYSNGVNTLGGNITLTTSAGDIVVGEAAITAGAAEIDAGGGNISISAAGNIGLKGVNGNAVTLTAGGNVGDSPVGASKIVANSLAITAGGSIGGATAALNTAAGSLSASSTGGGNINISEFDAVSLGLVSTTGNVSLTVGGTIADSNGTGTSNVNANSATITAAGMAIDTQVTNLQASTSAFLLTVREADALNLNASSAAGVDVSAGGNINVGGVTTSGQAKLVSGGAISGSGTATHITAASADLTAATGIGGTNGLLTQLAGLKILNGTGNTRIVNTGTLNVTGMSNTGAGDILLENTGGIFTGTQTITASGSVSFVAHSPITIGSGGISASGNISLTAGQADAATALDTVTLNGSLTSTGAGNIQVTAADSITQNANITSAGGSIDLSSTTGGITMAAGTSTTSGGGSISYSANQDILLASVNAGSGNVKLLSTSGKLSQQAGGSITGSTVDVTAKTGIKLTTNAKQLLVTNTGPAGTVSITDANSGTVFSDVPTDTDDAAETVTESTLSELDQLTPDSGEDSTDIGLGEDEFVDSSGEKKEKEDSDSEEGTDGVKEKEKKSDKKNAC